MSRSQPPDSALPRWEWLGTVPYRQALERQRAHRHAVRSGQAAPALWMMEHLPVVTEGRRAPPIPTPVSVLAQRGIDWVRTERGGLATYHGPGQLVGYLICDISRLGLSIKATVASLEQGIMSWMGEHGLGSRRRPGYPGVWIARAKIAAVGMNFQRNVSMHGFAINLTVDLEPYSLIVPCGITDGQITSLEALVGERAPTPAQAAPSVASHVLDALTTASLAPLPGSP